MGRTGIRISFLASLLAAGAACGSVKDSGAVDAGGDAPDADQSGDATVTTKSAHFGQTIGAPLGDVEIISSLPDGKPLATGKTDAAGSTSIKVVPGGIVTAAYRRPTDMGWEFISVVGVNPGETIDFGNRNPQFFCPNPQGSPCNVSLGSVQYNWTVQPGATQTIVLSACNVSGVAAPTATVTREERPDCAQNPIDAVFISLTGSAVTGCTTRQNVNFPGPVTAGTPSQAPFAVIANITGIPPEVTNVGTQFSPVINSKNEVGVNFVNGFARSSGVNSGGAFTGNFQYCNIGKRTLATLSLSRQGFLSMRVVDSLPSSATSWTVSSPMLPPFIENNSFLTSPSQRRAEWVLSQSEGTAHDAVVVSFGWGLSMGNITNTMIWSFVLPPGTTEVRLPQLPASFDMFMPTAETGLGIQSIRTIEIPTVPSYDAFRQLGTANGLCPECATRAGDIQRAIISGF